jgi:hypothetical protein
MLRLTVSDNIKQRERLEASRGWYESVRRDYAIGALPK